FIGSGNVATVLAKRFYKNGFTIHEVYSRTEANAVELCNLVNAKPINNIEQLSKNADVYIICVSDKALVEISPHINFNNK
ncbi:NAD(P)-binding domain-containing protein, partial [Acinetobacter baumannii]